MQRARIPSLVTLALLLALLSLEGCHCGKQTDEEILKERIDTTSVHLYLATKVAVVKSDATPEAREAKRQLDAALTALRGTAVAAVAKPAGSAVPAVAPAPTAAASTEPPRRVLTPSDLAKLAKALWGLKSEGKALLKGRREDDLPPILPLLMGESVPPELLALLDTNTEHGLFLITLFALKFHPRNPVPVPPEILLYEAWMARAEGMKLPGMSIPVRALKAVVYAQNELCDLAATEGEGLENEQRLTTEMLNQAMASFGAPPSKAAAAEVAELFASARALAHGAAALCYFQRKEKPKALVSLDKFITAAHDAGVPPSETALPRAYLFYEKGEYERAQACLEEAKNDPSVDPETRKQIEVLTVKFTKKDDNAISKAFDKTYFTVLVTKLIYLRLQRSGAIDKITETEAARTLRDYLFAATGMLTAAKESIPTADGMKKRGGALLDGLKK